MRVTIMPGGLAGSVSAIPSKSHLHRLLIHAALADKETLITCANTDAEDINATIDCLSALGASVERCEDGFAVKPCNFAPLRLCESSSQVTLPCMESGSTLRFMLPVVCALGVRAVFQMKGRLPERPMAPLETQLENHGIRLWREKPDLLYCEGKLTPGEYHLPGDISSQYITGLLMALPLLDGPSRLTVAEPVESADYIAMTLEVAEAFGHKPEINQNHYDIQGMGVFTSPGRIAAEGDWSNGAFWLCAGAMPGGDIELRGLKKDSRQGDRVICDILAQMGASVKWDGGILRITEGGRHGTEIDIRAIPDLGPVLAAVAAAGTGTTVIRNAARLRLKESDRLFSTAQTLNALGADLRETEGSGSSASGSNTSGSSTSLIVNGRPRLTGGEVDSFGDHRIAMMAAIASAACTQAVTISGAEAVNKSYPAFWKDFAALGKVLKAEV